MDYDEKYILTPSILAPLAAFIFLATKDIGKRIYSKWEPPTLKKLPNIWWTLAFIGVVVACIGWLWPGIEWHFNESGDSNIAQLELMNESDGMAAYKWGDFATAFHKLKPLAERGHAKAQFVLGMMYSSGQGVPKELKRASHWFRKAAEQGDASAQYNLGLIYEQGLGVIPNYIESYIWFNLAAVQGHINAKEDLHTLTSRMTPQQIAEAQRLAREWKPTPKRAD